MNLIMVQDAREKKGKHKNIEDYCANINLPIIRKMLNVGDYVLATMENGCIKHINNISVDIKGGGLQELANDLYADKLAFNKKYKKCYKENIKLVVLIEEKVNTLKELMCWNSKHTKITGRYLLELINDLKLSYGIKFQFCDKNQTGEILIKLLKGE